MLEEILTPFKRLCEMVEDSYRLLHAAEQRRLATPRFYNKALIDGQQFVLDDRERARIFLWSPADFTLNIVSPVETTVTVTTGAWLLLGFISGTAFTTTGLADLTTVVFKCTNDIVV